MIRKLVFLTVSGAVLLLAACGGGSNNASPAIGGGGGGSFCDTLKTDTAVFQKLGSQANPQQIEGVVTDLANKAPSEIKGDMQTLADGIKQFASISSQLSADPGKASSFGSDLQAQGAKLTAASQNVEKFAKDKCGIDLTSASSGSSTDSSTDVST